MSETADPTPAEAAPEATETPAPEPAPAPEAPAAEPAAPSKRKIFSQVLRIALGVLTLLLAVKGVHSLVPQEDHEPNLQPPAHPQVRVLDLQEEQIPAREERYGRLLPVQEWTLALEVGGRVKERPAFNGQRLKAGDLIVALDPEPFEAEQARAQASVTESESGLTLAHSTLARVEKLRASTATKENLDQARTEVERATAAVAAAKAQLRLATYRLEHSRLVAPAPGIVSQLGVEVGDALGAGQPIGRHSRVDTLLVKLLVSGDVRRGVELEDAATVIDGREGEHGATLARAAPVQSRGTGQFELEFEVGNPAGALLAGEAVRCRFEHGGGLAKLRIPRSAVYEEYGTWRALVAPATTTGPFVVGSTPVVLGAADPQEGWVEVVSGLKPGDRLVVPERMAAIHEGQRVVSGQVTTSWLPPYAGKR